MFLRLTLLSASALVFHASFAVAQDAPAIAPIEVTGFRPAAPDRATASVSVLTQDDLAVRASPNPADQLRAAPGTAVSRSGTLGGLTQVRLRGAEANHTLVLYDGIEVSDPVTGETDFGTLTALPVRRIEVLRGASSSIHGSDAIGGVVWLSPARGRGVSGFAEGGSFDTAQGALGWSGDRFGVGLSGLATDGVDASGTGGEKDGSQSISGIVTAGLDLGADWSLSLVGLVRRTESDFDTDTDFDGRLNDADRRTEGEQQLVGGALRGMAGPIDHVIRASFNEVARDNFSDGALADTATGERTKISWSPGYTTGVHRVAGLVDFERETYERADVEFGGLTNASEAFEALAVAGEYGLSFGALDVSASARFDDNKGRFDDAETWHAGAGYAFDDLGGRLRASIATSVKNPTFTELFGFFTGSFVGNPELKPEKSKGWEIGWAQDLGAAEVEIVYFEADLDNEIFTAFNPDFTSTARNRTGKSERSGIELSGRWQALSNLALSGQATVFESQNDAGADEVRVPELSASLSADWQVEENGLRLGLALDHVGEQRDFDFGSFPSRLVALEAYTLASLTAEYPITDGVALTLRGENLFDETVVDVFGYNGPGAGVLVGLKLK